MFHVGPPHRQSFSSTVRHHGRGWDPIKVTHNEGGGKMDCDKVTTSERDPTGGSRK